MNGLIYFFVSVILIGLFFMIIPILLPIIVILILAVAIYTFYLKYKIKKNMGQYEQDMSSYQSDSTQYGSNDEDIIDVEFTQTDETDKE